MFSLYQFAENNGSILNNSIVYSIGIHHGHSWCFNKEINKLGENESYRVECVELLIEIAAASFFCFCKGSLFVLPISLFHLFLCTKLARAWLFVSKIPLVLEL